MEGVLFIINVNVLFLSNSQQAVGRLSQNIVVYHQCQCSLFKQFTTFAPNYSDNLELFIINVNVLFLSNSQLGSGTTAIAASCLSSMSMFSF